MGHTAIETRYAACRFRSRLEARWAVFFDYLDIKWDYEPQGYTIGPADDRINYLPDFWLPDLGVWVEVKGDATVRDLKKVLYAAQPEIGLPGRDHGQRILLLGNIPRVDVGWGCWQHSLAYCSTPEEYATVGLYTRSFTFQHGGAQRIEDWGIYVDPANLDYRAKSIWQFDAFTVADNWGALYPADERLSSAYQAARSARFEHGERG